MKSPLRLFLPAALMLAFPRIVLSAPTQEEFLRSLSDNINRGDGSSHGVALLCGLMACILLMVLVAQRNKSKASPKELNHHGKLLKEVCRATGIKPRQRKRLRQLTQQTAQRLDKPITSPLTLLICPSLNEKKP